MAYASFVPWLVFTSAMGLAEFQGSYTLFISLLKSPRSNNIILKHLESTAPNQFSPKPLCPSTPTIFSVWESTAASIIFPALEPTERNKHDYRVFLDEVIAEYSETHDAEGRREDGKVLQLPDDDPNPKWPPSKHYIEFMYIDDVYEIAKKYFGYSVRFWDESEWDPKVDRRGCYGWDEVYDMDQKLKALSVEGENIIAGDKGDQEAENQDSAS
ncbi:hypothetical protein B0H66DRAFT_536526 [Apodospora peruviana]|uniref:Uncharacterized protein n=1 Tax=Apodospora peruviana TaxID=516989 RepID=A0AAE0M1H7_9PEZI|nr:hypothetical protein B0H66DRAFT_536526 [Apodospora peruviana]